MKQVVIGVFDNSAEAQTAVQQLINQGFTNEDIDLSVQSGQSGITDREGTQSDLSDRETQGEDFGDKVSNFFKSLFGDSDDASKYSQVTKRGSNSIVTVYVDTSDEAERAAYILDEYGAIDVDERATQYRTQTSDTYNEGSNFSDTSRRDVTSDRDLDLDITDANTSDKKIDIIEEDLQIGKRAVRTGGVKVHSRVIEKPVEETIKLRQEHVNLQRNPVNRAATDADLSNLKDQTIEVTEFAERPVVSKEARVVEEVRLNKEIEEREEVIRDSVRRTDVDIENLNPEDERTTRRTDLDDDQKTKI